MIHFPNDGWGNNEIMDRSPGNTVEPVGIGSYVFFVKFVASFFLMLFLTLWPLLFFFLLLLVLLVLSFLVCVFFFRPYLVRLVLLSNIYMACFLEWFFWGVTRTKKTQAVPWHSVPVQALHPWDCFVPSSRDSWSSFPKKNICLRRESLPIFTTTARVKEHVF